MGNAEQAIRTTEKKFVLKDYWQIFLRRKWIIIIPIILLPAIIIPISYLMTPVYKATTTLISQEVSPNSFLRDITDSPRGEQMSSIKYKIQSRANMKEVADKVGIEQYLRSENKPNSIDDQVRYMRNLIKIRSLGGLVIEISATHPRPNMAKNIADTVARSYVDRTLKWRQDSATTSTKFIQSELENYRNKLHEAEIALANEQAKGVIDSIPSETFDITNGNSKQTFTKENNPLINDAVKLKTDLVEVEMDLQEANGELNNARKFSGSSDGNEWNALYITDPEYSRLQKELNNLELLYRQQSVKYTDDYPMVRKIKTQMDQTQNELNQVKSRLGNLQEDSSVRAKYWSERVRSLELKRTVLTNKINEYDKKLQQLPQRQMELTRLQREKAVAENVYSMLLQKLNSTELSQSSELQSLGSVAEILDPAIDPDKPISPNRKKITMMAFALGIGIGFGLTFLLEYFNRSFRSVDDVVNFFGIPVLATIPRLVTADSETQAKRDKKILIISLVLLASLALMIIGEISIAWFLDRNSFFVNIFNNLLDFIRKRLNKIW